MYADPTRCPDCRSTLPPAPGACPACALPLTGPAVEELFATLQRADRLLATVRATAVPVARHEVTAPEPVRRGLSAPSVPMILLGLGAVCLLVAAVTFLVFAWSWLGVGGRTAVLVALTAGSGVLAEALRRRGLRVAAESLSVITLGLLGLDTLGADNAGWLGDPTSPALLAAVGLALALPSLAWTALVHRQRGEPLVAPQVAGVVGLSAVALGWGVHADELVVAAAVVTAGLLGLAALGRRLELAPTAAVAAIAAACWWLPLTLVGLARAVDHATVAELAGQLRAWPLVASAVLLAAATLLVRTSPVLVVAGLGTAATLITVIPLVVAADNPGADLAWVLVIALLAWSAVLLRLPTWRGLLALVPLAAVALAAGALVVTLVLDAATAVEVLVDAPWSHPWTVRTAQASGLDPTGTPPMLVVPLLVGLLAATLAWRIRMRGLDPSLTTTAIPAAAVVALGTAAAAASYEQPLALVLAVAAAAGLVLVGWGLHREGDQASLVGCGAAVLLVTVWASLPSVGLTAAVASLAAATAVTVALRSGRDDLRALGLLAAPALGGLAVWTIGDLAGLPEVWRAAPVVLLLGLLVILVPRPEIELAAIPTAVTAALASTWASSAWATPLAAYLTLGGALLIASSVVNAERRWLAWAGGLLLAGATWVRLWDVGVTTPEAYTMPSALALLAVGLVRLARDRDADTWTTISAGLLLATVPSLLTVMTEEPASLRALLLGLGCLVLVLGGAALRWSAPLLVGAGVGLVLVLREWGPYAADLPPWVVIGVAGSLLLVVGVTWEARLLELRRGTAYLARLR